MSVGLRYKVSLINNIKTLSYLSINPYFFVEKNAMYYMFWITFGTAMVLTMIGLVMTLLKSLNKRHRRQTQTQPQNHSSPPPYSMSEETNDIRKIALA